MIKLITDSTSYIPKDYAKQHDITILPLTITINNKEFRDDDISCYDEFYSLVASTKEQAKTSQPNIEFITNVFENVIKNGDEAIVVLISSSLSGTYNTCEMLKNQLDKNNQITLVDSGSTAQNIFGYIEEAVEMREKNCTRQEIVEHIKKVASVSPIIFIPDNLDALKNGGRIGKLSAIIGTLLHIKPIISFKNGVLTCVKKALGMNKAISELIASVPANVKKIFVLQISKSKFYEYFRNLVKSKFPKTNIVEAPVGPAVGTHIGNAIGLTCIVNA